MTWQGLEQKLAALKIHWDRIQDEYVFADGSHLDPKRQMVEENSAQWEFTMPVGLVGNVLVTRGEPDWVDVDISYSLTQGARIPEAEIEVVHSTGHHELSHVISPSRSRPKTFVDHGWGFDVDLLSGEGIRISLPINGKWLTSPILVP